MTPGALYDAIVAAITAITPSDTTAGKGDRFVHHDGYPDDLPERDRRFALVPIVPADRLTERGSKTEIRSVFQLWTRYHLAGAANWRRILNDSKSQMDAITALHTSVADVTRVFEDGSDVLYQANRTALTMREFTVTYRGE